MAQTEQPNGVKYVCIHGHFYQPPRENPWLEAIEIQDSAAPFHDWNEKIAKECYKTNGQARLLGADGRIIAIRNNYERISFNFGPTLLSWLERRDPQSYAKIIEADRLSIERFGGHGNALAQCYNHTIMPLSSPRDKLTQVRWGIADFQHRFGRAPEGMWLPETAVDLETLETLAEHEIKFTLLAPDQAGRFRTGESEKWVEVNHGGIDPTRAYLCQLPSGKSIALFFYDGPISHDIAFGGLLSDGVAYAQRLLGGFWDKRTWPQLVLAATDGESYGHHHRFGDMALAKALEELERAAEVELINPGLYLARHPPTAEVELITPSSWSCAHGVERWRSDCGCRSGRSPASWSQEWRGGLRDALDWLREQLDPVYEKEAAARLKDPWAARDEYLELLLDRSPENCENFFQRHGRRALNHGEKIEALKLLELQRHRMLMYTSCAWFFDELAGIEPVQNMKYASRAFQLAAEFGLSLEEEFIKRLKEVASNLPEFGNGARIYQKLVKPARVDLQRVVAHAALVAALEGWPGDQLTLYCYQLHLKDFRQARSGRHSLAVGRLTVRSETTLEAEEAIFAVISLGNHDLQCAIRGFLDYSHYADIRDELFETFKTRPVFETVRALERHFDRRAFTLKDMFLESLRKFLVQLTDEALAPFQGLGLRIYEENYELMDYLRAMQAPLPPRFLLVAETALSDRLAGFLKDFDCAADLSDIATVLEEARRWGAKLDLAPLTDALLARLEELFDELEQKGVWAAVERIERLLVEIDRLELEFPLEPLQNRYFQLIGQLDQLLARAAATGGGRKVRGKGRRGPRLRRLGKILGFHQDVLKQVEI